MIEEEEKKNCSSNSIFTLIKESELIIPFNNEQTFNTTISKYNFSENESSPIKEFHSENVKKTKETILENIMEFTKNCKKIIMLDIENNNNIDPFQKEYFDELKNDEISLNDFLDYFYNYIKVAFDKACKNALTELEENEKLKSQMPIDQLREEIKKVIKFYKIYELVNQKLIESIKENSNLNKELSTILANISQEKRKVDELLTKVMQRLKDTNLNFQELNKNFSNLITSEMQEYINFSNSSKENLINYIEKFLSEKSSGDNKNVYNEEEYIQFTQQLEERICKIQKNDQQFDEKLSDLIKAKENELNKKREGLENAEFLEKNESYHKKVSRSPIKEDYEKMEESNKIYRSDRDLDREKEKLEADLREKQDRLKKLIREKNLIEKNLEDKYEKELISKKNMTATLSFVLLILVGVLIFQSFYL